MASSQTSTAPNTTTDVLQWSWAVLIAVLCCCLLQLLINALIGYFRLNVISSSIRVSVDSYWLCRDVIVLFSLFFSYEVYSRLCHTKYPLFLQTPKLIRRSIFISILLGIFSLLVACIILVILFVPPPKLRVYAAVADYDIAVEQVFAGYDIGFNTYLVITHRNSRYSSDLDSDTDCTSLATIHQDNRIYFVCNDEPISVRTPYVDVGQESVFMGGDTPRHEVSLTNISYY